MPCAHARHVCSCVRVEQRVSERAATWPASAFGESEWSVGGAGRWAPAPSLRRGGRRHFPQWLCFSYLRNALYKRRFHVTLNL
jgi:hypothetical protein